MNSTAHLGFDYFLNNLTRLFSQKSRKLPIPAMAMNIQIGITLFLYKISTQKNFACMVGFSRSANSNMLSKFSREPRELP